jgi:fatty-acyl-CoA synthase
MSDRHFSSWPPKVPRELTLPETSLWYNLEVSATRYPTKRATVFYDSVLTYAELRQQAEQLAGYLQRECGVQRGDRVAVFMQNCPQFIVAFYAALRADAMVVPINPMNMTTELAYLLADSGAKTIFVAQDLLPQLAPLLTDEAALPGLTRAVVTAYSDYLTEETTLYVPDFLRVPLQEPNLPRTSTWQAARASGLAPLPHQAGPEDLCVLPYTSGTTGHPKGCVHTHATVMHTALASPSWHRNSGNNETSLTVLPLFHVTGMQNCMNAPIYAGGTMVIMSRWDRDAAAALIQRYRVTSWTSVPTMVVDLLSSPSINLYDLSSLQTVGGGGAAMPEAIAQRLEKLTGLAYLEGYGLSETIAATHINPVQNPKKQCLGIPIFGVDSRVVNPETLQEVGTDEVGEIITHGPQVFQGYWNRPEANAECFVTLHGKRFFRTGDLGRIDAEGYFFLVDRIKRMINASGFKVWPAEVESMLYAHPAIKEAAIIAQRHPRRGETVKAVVALKPGSSLGEEELIAWARGQMAAYKVPRSVEFVEALPKNGSGKIMWRTLQELEDKRIAEAG